MQDTVAFPPTCVGTDSQTTQVDPLGVTADGVGGLEAAYLASGQARRVEELRQTLITWRQLRPRPFDINQGIELGVLVQLAAEDGHEQWLFLGPPGASMKLQLADQTIQVLGNTAPLGKLLLGKKPGDEISLPVGSRQQIFEVLAAT